MADNNINKKIFSGIIWKFAERFAAQGVSFLVSLVLARILMPDDYGTVAIINVFINVADTFLTCGLNTSLIQKQNVGELEFSTIFWCNLALGFILYIIFFITAPLIATAYKLPILTMAIRVFALRLPISSFQSIQTAFVSRNMDFKKFFFATIIGTVISAVVGITMALKGFGVWALIAQYMTNTVIDTFFLFLTVKWYPHLMFSWKAVKPLVQYGSKILLTYLIGSISSNLGDFIIGLKYSSSDLAYYSKGKQIPALIKSNIYSSILSVLFSGMSKVNDSAEKVKTISRNSIKMLTYVLYPMMFGLMVVAMPLIVLLYTDKWISMVPFVRISCIEVLLSVPGTITLQSVKASGRSDLMLKAEFIKKPILFLSIFSALNFGVFAVALTLPFNALLDIFVTGYMAQKSVGYSILEQLCDCCPALLMSMIMGAVVYLVSLLPINMYLILGLQIILGVAIYLLLSILTKNSSFQYIKKVAFSKFRKVTINESYN